MDKISQALPFIIALATFLGLRALAVVFVWHRLLQAALHPLRVMRSDAPFDLLSHQQAAVAEIEALGFRPIGWVYWIRGETRIEVVQFQHQRVAAYAELMLRAPTGTHYPLTITSFLADGRLLATSNRFGFALPCERPGEETHDPLAQSAAEHWQAHIDLLKGHATAELDTPTALARLDDVTTDLFDCMVRAGAIQQYGQHWRYTPKAAWRVATRWRRVKSQLNKAYRSESTSDANLPSFFAEVSMHTQADIHQSGQRPGLRRNMLLLSVALSFIGYGFMFGWMQAAALIGLIFIHESGHALAMRAFGWRDVNMFFVPFMGAVATGRSTPSAAWKQAVMYLAGPVPGLLGGLAGLWWLAGHPQPPEAFDWDSVAHIAVFLNLFNLLPITPLDGGRLMEVALFNRWPLARFAFYILSIGALLVGAFKLNTAVMWALPGLMVFGVKQQWHAARMQPTCPQDITEPELLRHLFANAIRSTGWRTYARLNTLVRKVQQVSEQPRTRGRETITILGVFIVLWLGAMTVFN